MHALRVAYLAPEIPALSATFVYEELHALEKRGIIVQPVSVHQPESVVQGETDLIGRAVVLYDRPKWRIAFSGLTRMHSQPGAIKALQWLLSDMHSCKYLGEAWKLAFQFLAAVRLSVTLKEQRCTHLHIHFAHVPTQIGMYAAAMAEIPFTVMAHANDIFERGLLLRQKAQRARKFLTISEHNRRFLLSLGLPREKLAVVRCGVSFEEPAIWPKPSQKPRYRLGTLGRLVEKKGVDVLLRAIAKVGSIHLSIAGDGPLRAELESLTKELGIEESVEFFGSISHHEVAAWLSQLDVFVLACKQDRNGDMDGIPVVLMEAMSQGVPVISTSLSGISELVVHESTGYLATPGDSVDLANQILRVLSSAELRSQLALQAKGHVQEEFAQSVNIDRLLGFIKLESL
jgi:colanic acid/amylovoran biosynthesis glycosyltransferase